MATMECSLVFWDMSKQYQAKCKLIVRISGYFEHGQRHLVRKSSQCHVICNLASIKVSSKQASITGNTYMIAYAYRIC